MVVEVGVFVAQEGEERVLQRGGVRGQGVFV